MINEDQVKKSLSRNYAEELLLSFISKDYLKGIVFLLKEQEFYFFNKTFNDKIIQLNQEHSVAINYIKKFVKNDKQNVFNTMLNSINTINDVAQYDFSIVSIEDLIHYAIKLNNQKQVIAVQRLLEFSQYNLDKKTEIPLLHLACKSQNIGVVEILLKMGADPNILDSNKIPAIMHTLWNKNQKVFNLLIDAGTDMHTIVQPSKLKKFNADTSSASLIKLIYEQAKKDENFKPKPVSKIQAQKKKTTYSYDDFDDDEEEDSSDTYYGRKKQNTAKSSLKTPYQIPAYFYFCVLNNANQEDIDFKINALNKIKEVINWETIDDLGQNALFYLVQDKDFTKGKQFNVLTHYLSGLSKNFFQQKNYIGNTCLYYIDKTQNVENQWLNLIQPYIDFSSQNVYGQTYLDTLKNNTNKKQPTNNWFRKIEKFTENSALMGLVGNLPTSRKMKL